jgi:hypothetical protein
VYNTAKNQEHKFKTSEQYHDSVNRNVLKIKFVMQLSERFELTVLKETGTQANRCSDNLQKYIC